MTQQSKLFKFAYPEKLNSCICGSFNDYAYIYRDSALLFLNLLIISNCNEDLKKLLKTHLFSIDNEHIVSPNNDYVIAAIFLYRHSIELELKSLLLTLKSKECISKKTTPNRKKIIDKLKNHSLSDLWNMVNPILQKYYKKTDCKKLISLVSHQIEELNKFDPDSTAFRYPYANKVENNEFVKNLNDISHINLLVFYKEINKLCDNIQNFKYYLIDEFEFFYRILCLTESCCYKDLNKNINIPKYRYKVLVKKIKLLCEKFIEPQKNILNKNLVRDLCLLKEKTIELCDKQANNLNTEETLKEINNARRRIKYQCEKIVGLNKNYF